MWNNERNQAAKAEILARIKRAHELGNPEKTEPVLEYIRDCGKAPGSQELIDDFIEKLEDYTAKVVCCAPDQVPAEISKYLNDCKSVVVPTGLEQSWKDACAEGGRSVTEDSREQQTPNLELDKIDAVVTGSRCGVSLSGTIILDGEPDQGRRAITLVPDTHVVVVKKTTVFGSVPEAVKLLSENPQRPMTWIAGPSATSDIELCRVDGVHGPRNLRVIIVDE